MNVDKVKGMEKEISGKVKDQRVSGFKDDGNIEFKDICNNLLHPFIIFNRKQLIFTVNMSRKLVGFAFTSLDYFAFILVLL